MTKQRKTLHVGSETSNSQWTYIQIIKDSYLKPVSKKVCAKITQGIAPLKFKGMVSSGGHGSDGKAEVLNDHFSAVFTEKNVS